MKEDYSSESIIQEDLDEMSDEMLNFTLARFVAEVRKEDDQEYAGKWQLLALIPLELLFPINKLMDITLLNTTNCGPYYQSPLLHLLSVFESFSSTSKQKIKFAMNEKLNANGTVDNVVSYQFLCTLHIKCPKTGCNIFNIAACTLQYF